MYHTSASNAEFDTPASITYREYLPTDRNTVYRTLKRWVERRDFECRSKRIRRLFFAS